MAASHIADITEDTGWCNGVIAGLLADQVGVPVGNGLGISFGLYPLRSQVFKAFGESANCKMGPRTYGGQTVTRSKQRVSRACW